MELAYLTQEELQEITGYKKPCKQMEWLRMNGFTVFENAKNRPVVSRSNFDLVTNGVASHSYYVDAEPDFRTLH